MNLFSVLDIAIELNRRYRNMMAFSHRPKKGEKSFIFLNILTQLYHENGERLGYGGQFHQFKSDVIVAQKSIKKNKKNLANKTKNYLPPLEIF